METLTSNIRHSKSYYKWLNFKCFWKYKVPDFFRYLFYLPRNYFLVKKYPFLKPSCGWGVDMEYHRKGYRYHYEETWLDGMPRGWRKAFGRQLCEDLKKALANCCYNTNDYKVHQVKEKFGELCWYDEGGNNITRDVINKYEQLSTKTCQICGAEAEYVTAGWIGYYCGNCVKKFKNRKYRKLGIYDTI